MNEYIDGGTACERLEKKRLLTESEIGSGRKEQE